MKVTREHISDARSAVEHIFFMKGLSLVDGEGCSPEIPEVLFEEIARAILNEISDESI